MADDENKNEVEITKDVLANILLEAEEEHAQYEDELGEEDPDWHLWYAEYILKKFEEMGSH